MVLEAGKSNMKELSCDKGYLPATSHGRKLMVQTGRRSQGEEEVGEM